MSDSNSESVVVPRKTARPPSPVGHTARHYLFSFPSKMRRR